MFKVNDKNQVNLFSPMSNWNNFQNRRINKTWAKTFNEEIFPNIVEENFEILYSNDKASRPNTPVNVILGLLIIKELENLTDEEAMDALMFDTRVQYALNTIDNFKQEGSENTLNHFRRRLNDYYVKTGIDLLDDEIKSLNEKLIKISKINSNLRRIDSMMISSSCKNLNRIELVYEVNKNIVKKMKELGFKIKGFKKYIEESKKSDILYKTKSSEENNKLSNLLHDSVKIYNRIKNDTRINETIEFKNLERLLNDQYNFADKKPKDNKEIKPTSMQTPYDGEATYRFKYKNNKGYVGNVEEIIEVDDNKKTKKALISNWSVDQNIKSDKEYMKEFIDNNENKEVIVDSAYYSSELKKEAKERNITIHPTELVGQKPSDNLLEKFKIDEKTKEVLMCPKYQKPIETKYKEDGTIIAKFNKEKCFACPLRDKCIAMNKRVKGKLESKLSTYERYKEAKTRLESEYIKTSNLRAGIEGIPSVMRRRYHIDNRAGKGLLRLKIKYCCSMISINIKRITKMNNKMESLG